MAETLLVVRDGNSNSNSSPTFLFSVCGHPRIPHVSKNMDASCRRKSNNGKRTRKRTQLTRFEHGNAICNVQFLPRTATLHRNIYYTTSWLFHDIGSGASFGSLLNQFAILIFACLCSPRLATGQIFIVVFLLCVIFLMLHHSLCCLNFSSCVTSHK